MGIEDRILSDFLKSIGPWSDHVIIGGGYALIIYELYLADKVLNSPVSTTDIDSLVLRKLPYVSNKNLALHLKEAGFTTFYKDRDIPASECYLKNIDGFEVEIEFLTDNDFRGDKNKNLIVSGVSVQPLSYLNLSMQNTIEFRTYSGIVGKVTSPGAWIFHKGLTFIKRKELSKRYKDLYGVWYVLTQLNSFSQDAIKEFEKLKKVYSSWFKTFKNNLENWILNAAKIDWDKLEIQDPSGSLRKSNFLEAVNSLLYENSNQNTYNSNNKN